MDRHDRNSLVRQKDEIIGKDQQSKQQKYKANANFPATRTNKNSKLGGIHFD